MFLLKYVIVTLFAFFCVSKLFICIDVDVTDEGVATSCISYLLSQVVHDGIVLAVVTHVGPCFLHGLSDLLLQYAVLLLKLAYRLQVGGQTVIQVLHLAPLITQDVAS